MCSSDLNLFLAIEEILVKQPSHGTETKQSVDMKDPSGKEHELTGPESNNLHN